jgi:hypothetical protein
MRGRIVLFAVLAAVVALVAVYVGWSTSTPKAAGEPSTATPSDSTVRSTQQQASGSTPSRSPAASSPKAPAPKVSSPTSSPQAEPKPKPKPKSKPKPGSQPRPSTDPVRFGPVSTTPSDDTLDVSTSDDRRALSATFSALEVTVGDPDATDVTTRSFAMTVPLTKGVKGNTLKVFAQGYVVTEKEGATARLTLRGNGRTTVENFPAGWDDSFLHVMELPATPGTTYRLTAVIEIHQNRGTDGQGYANIASIEIGLF